VNVCAVLPRCLRKGRACRQAHRSVLPGFLKQGGSHLKENKWWKGTGSATPFFLCSFSAILRVGANVNPHLSSGSHSLCRAVERQGRHGADYRNRVGRTQGPCTCAASWLCLVCEAVAEWRWQCAELSLAPHALGRRAAKPTMPSEFYCGILNSISCARCLAYILKDNIVVAWLLAGLLHDRIILSATSRQNKTSKATSFIKNIQANIICSIHISYPWMGMRGVLPAMR
jgi:hypothetical protein